MTGIITEQTYTSDFNIALAALLIFVTLSVSLFVTVFTEFHRL